jgi:hypothetical protein
VFTLAAARASQRIQFGWCAHNGRAGRRGAALLAAVDLVAAWLGG